MKTTKYTLGVGPHLATRVEHADGTVEIRMFDGAVVGHGNSAKDAALHLAEQLRTLARFVEGHEGSFTVKPTITDDQLRYMFTKHCQCRPLDFNRTKDDHAAIHDCDTGILIDVQVALGIVKFDDIGRVQAMREARQRCADRLADAVADAAAAAARATAKERA